MSVRVSVPRTARHPTQPCLAAQPWKRFPWGHRAGWESAFGTLSAHPGAGNPDSSPRPETTGTGTGNRVGRGRSEPRWVPGVV